MMSALERILAHLEAQLKIVEERQSFSYKNSDNLAKHHYGGHCTAYKDAIEAVKKEMK